MTGEQLGMVALLHDLPVVDVADLIRILDRGQAVRDDEARASLEQMVQTGLQRLLGTRVDIRRGLVEDQDARVGEQHARERDELALAVLAIRTISMKWTVVFALAFAGALGNLIDRVMYAEGFLNGKVVDFLNYGWSVGNVADIFLMVAGVAAVVLLFVGEPFSQKDLDEQAAEQTKQTTGDQNA